jgi:hypothetical protein
MIGHRHKIVHEEVARQSKQLVQFNDALWLIAHDVVDATDIDAEPGWCLLLNLNDTFAYACADAEEFGLRDASHLQEIYVRYGHGGVIAWAAIRRCTGDPIRVYACYEEALHDLRVKQATEGYCREVFSNPKELPVIAAGQQLHGFVEQNGDWWLGYCLELDQTVQGKTRDEARYALAEVVPLWLDSVWPGKWTADPGTVTVPGDWWYTTVKEKA